jgi:hypothetical protein
MTTTSKLALLGLFGSVGLMGCGGEEPATTSTATTTTNTGTTGTTGTTGSTDICTPYGPDNTWDHACVEDIPADLAGTGFKTGDIANNFSMLDQHGNQTELYQFYGEIVIVDVFTYW